MKKSPRKKKEIKEEFPDETLMELSIKDKDYPWFTDMANYKDTGQPPKGMKFHERKKVLPRSHQVCLG